MSRNLNHLSHANLLIGTPEEAESHLRLLCNELGISPANNPDFIFFKAESFGIDEARELRLLATRKTLSTGKIFLITSLRLTVEAQNALLKTFEDPFPGTYFFLAVREEDIIVPTLRSRMQTLHLSERGSLVNLGLSDAGTFLSSSLKDRLLFAREFADDPPTGGKNLPVFLDNLLSLLRKRSEMRVSLEKVYKIRCSIGNAVITPRLVIEHLSLILP